MYFEQITENIYSKRSPRHEENKFLESLNRKDCLFSTIAITFYAVFIMQVRT